VLAKILQLARRHLHHFTSLSSSYIKTAFYRCFSQSHLDLIPLQETAILYIFNVDMCDFL